MARVHVLLLVLLGLIAFSVFGISGSLRRLADHHLLFAPEAPPVSEAMAIASGSVLIVRENGVEQIATVKSVVADSAGKLYCQVESSGPPRAF